MYIIQESYVVLARKVSKYQKYQCKKLKANQKGPDSRENSRHKMPGIKTMRKPTGSRDYTKNLQQIIPPPMTKSSWYRTTDWPGVMPQTGSRKRSKPI